MSHYHLPHNHGQDIDKVLDKMPAEENFRDIAILFQQLSDPSRLRLLWLLCHSEECVCNLAAAVQMSAPAISHHLKNLKSSGLITSAGRERKSTILYPTQALQNFSIKPLMPCLKYLVRLIDK